MIWEEVVNHIPHGSENRISKEALTALTGYNDRTIRQAVEDARRKGIKIVTSSGKKGYYIADNDDDWLLFLEEHRRRALAELSLYNEGIKHLDNRYVTAQIIPVKAHVRHLKADLPFEGQIALEV